MSDIWMGIMPESKATRVLAMAGPNETILKGRLSPQPSHPRAIATLLEAVALWQGQRVRAALGAGERDGGSDLTFYQDALLSDGSGPLYSLQWVPACRAHRPRHRDIGGMGDYSDLRQLLLFEVAQ